MPDAQTLPTPATTAPDLESMKQLINAATALNPAEKQYWLDLLPNMNEAQIQQLKGILESEQKNLDAIDHKYDQKLENVAEKYLSKWDSEKGKVERLKKLEEEKKVQTESEATAEALLKSW